MTLAQYTSPELIIPQLHSRDAGGVVAELCSALQRQGRVTDMLALYNAVMSRELMAATTAPPCWAMPHARLKDLPQLAFAVGRTAEPMNWFDCRGGQVRMVFLFAVPERDAMTYLRVISGLARLGQDTLRIETLLQARDSEELFQVLQQVPLRQLRAAAA